MSHRLCVAEISVDHIRNVSFTSFINLIRPQIPTTIEEENKRVISTYNFILSAQQWDYTANHYRVFNFKSLVFVGGPQQITWKWICHN